MSVYCNFSIFHRQTFTKTMFVVIFVGMFAELLFASQLVSP